MGIPLGPLLSLLHSGKKKRKRMKYEVIACAIRNNTLEIKKNDVVGE